MKKVLLLVLFLISSLTSVISQSVAREWNDVLLESIRRDFARPTVHARNLFHTSIALYDAFAVYDEVARPYFLGNEVHGFICPIDSVIPPADVTAAQEMTMSFAAYRLLIHRFQSSPGFVESRAAYRALMNDLGYDYTFTSEDYSTGDPAALGNYLGNKLIEFGGQDGSNEAADYANQSYEPENDPLVMAFSGNSDISDYNRWQPLTLDAFVDQSGNIIPFNTPPFLSPEWGIVSPFAMGSDDATDYQRDGFTYRVYHDPGEPPKIDLQNGGPMTEAYQWGFSMVCSWSSHLDPTDSVMIDISPGAQGNLEESQYPTTIEDLPDFYNWDEGGDISTGRQMNPKTGLPYAPNVIARGDYGRILAEFWADGPDSETPPGHWFTLLNYVNDHPDVNKRFKGLGNEMSDLEWDVKTYFTLGGAMHDAAVSAWGIKGWYDYLRPVSAIRAMAELGQSSDTSAASYHVGGLPLVPGKIELVEAGDALQGANGENIGKIKVLSWRGPDYITDPETDEAGVGWILAANWWPYQRPDFVTPNFAGYISGHSTFSRAAAEVLTSLTGDPYFPGGMGEFEAPMNAFLVFEQGPTETITLQWATYRDASDQCSLSRIWGGIHPPVDDIPGRLIGIKIGTEAVNLAEQYFYTDNDQDGFYSYLDCDDNDPQQYPGQVWYEDADGDGYGTGDSLISCTRPVGFVLMDELQSDEIDCDDNETMVYPNGVEICDELDNNCNNMIDEGVTLTFYLDQDGDGFGSVLDMVEACTAPIGYVNNANDCNDSDENEFPNQMWYEDADGDGFTTGMIFTSCWRPVGYVLTTELTSMEIDCDDDNENTFPDALEVCDEKDNDCDGQIDEEVKQTFYADQDGDGFGTATDSLSDCSPPIGYVSDNTDCNDNDANEFPGQMWFKDLDNDGYSDGTALTSCARPAGFRVATELYSMESDCDDEEAQINPDAIEQCDEIDNNCDGTIDEGVQFVYFADSDNDGFGNPADMILACTPPAGYILDDTDCNDADQNEFPGQIWYPDLDGDGYSSGQIESACQRPSACYLPTELISLDRDCNDEDAEIYPGAVEVCDEMDNNCDGFIDELVQSTYYVDADNDGYGDPNSIVFACDFPSPIHTTVSGDCNDSDANEYPNQEWYADLDQDGYSSGISHIACLRPPNYSIAAELRSLELDCDDNNSNVNPEATEIPDNGIDEDCSGFDLIIETKLYPNPFTDEMVVHLNTENEVEATIYNVSGQEVLKTRHAVINNVFNLNLGELPTGVYILEVESTEGLYFFTNKIIKI